jgi:hypothetical protein
MASLTYWIVANIGLLLGAALAGVLASAKKKMTIMIAEAVINRGLVRSLI